jgi:hypothetical protein
MPPGGRCVSRPSRYGNPFEPERLRDPDDHAKAVVLFREWITSVEQAWLLRDARRELRGRDLGCFCPLDRPCHADVLLELVNRPREIVIPKARSRFCDIEGKPLPRRVERHMERDFLPPPAWSFTYYRKQYGWKGDRHRREAVEGMANMAGVNSTLAERMLKGEIPYKVTIDEDLVFTVPME